jgi:hypothetical protein
MNKLVRSNEFGEWLVVEISRTRLESKSADSDRARSASRRLESLKIAKRVLLEFLLLQQAMLDAANEAYGRRA